MAQNPFSDPRLGSDLLPASQQNKNPFLDPDLGKETGGPASDLAKSLKVGAQRLPGMVTGLADLPIALATGARPFTKAADALGEATGFRPGKWADETKFSAGYEQGKKAVDDAWKDGSAGDIALAYLKNPGYTANTVAESVPGMLAGGLAARALMGVGRVAGVAAKAGGVGPAAPGLAERALGEWAAPVAAGVGEGAVTAGQQMAQYQGADQQKNALASLGAGAVTGALGVGAGRAANKLGLETAETAIAKAGTGATTEVPLSAKRRILGGMVSEALLQELPQSAQEQMWQNWADGKPLMEGVARQAVEGAVAGGVMGAGANVSGRPVAPKGIEAPATEDAVGAPLQIGHSPDPLIVFPDGTTGRKADVDAYLASLPEDRQQAERARLYGYAPQQADIGTSPGAADPNAPQRPAATVPEALDATTMPGAAQQHGNGVDFTREVDTGGLSLVDPAEQERARAATIDYQPGDTTPQWGTAPGAAPQRDGLDMPGREIDTGSLAVDTRTPSQRMGIDPAAGPLSRGAAQAVDGGTSAAAALAAQENANAQAASARPTGQAQATPIPATRPGAMEAAGPAPIASTTEGVAREPQAAQTQQAIPQPAQAGAAPAAEPASSGAGPQAAAGAPATGALTDGAPTANDGAQAAPATGPQGAAQAPAPEAVAQRPSNWRTSMLGAVPVARELGLAPQGKRLAQVVAEIDAADAQRAGVAHGGATAGEANATARDLRLADEGQPGAGAAAPNGTSRAAGGEALAVGAGQRQGSDPRQPDAAVRAGVPDAGGASESSAGVAAPRRGAEAMTPELARALLALRPPQVATKGSVRAAVNELVNGMGMLPNRLGRVVVATAAEIKQDWEPLIGPAGMEASGDAGQAQGFYDPNTKTVFLIADHIKAGDEMGVVAHELMHKHGQAVLGEEGWNQLHGAIGAWANAPEGSLERRVYDEAAARVQASGPELSTQELFPYAVQVALEMGVRPNGIAPQGSVARWLAQVRSMLRTVWNKIAGQKGDFNSLDLVNLAFGIAQRENPANAGELDAATQAHAVRAESALKQISDAEDLFALPKSNADTVEGIVADHDPDIKVRRTELPGNETMYTLTMPDGTRATITSREPTRDEVFGMNDVSGRWITERPGENAPPVGSRSDVWLDVSRLKPGRWGGVVYNIAATFAHNTGRIFIGDPSGLSDMALRRRAEQMLSSALKFGTTDHIAPHPRQVAGDASLGVPPLRWVYGDHEGNIRRLVDVNQQALENVYPEAKNLRYDLDTGNFIDIRTGQTVDPVRFDAGRERSVPARDRSGLVAGADGRGTSGVLGPAGAGGRTVARGAVFRALLRESSDGNTGARDQRGAESRLGRGEVVDGAVRQPDQSDPAADRNIRGDSSLLDGLAAQRSRLASADPDQRIFYSRSVAAAPATGDYTPIQARAAERAFGVQPKETLLDRAQAMRHNLGTKLRQGLVDQFAPIKEVSEKAYILARLSKGSDGAVEAALLYGKPFLRDGVADVDIKDGGFAKVLASLKGEDVRFFQWVAAQRAERLKAEGKENLLTDQDITALKTLNAGQFADGTPRLPAYAAALRELNAFNEASLKVAMESGLIDQAAYDLMKDQPYVPFYRLMEEDGGMKGPRFSSGLVNQQAWKKLKGGTQQINADLLQNTLMNWSHLYAAAARNRASLETMAAADKMGIAYQVPADTKGAVKVMRDGVAEHWAVEDPYLLDAISSMSYSPPGIVKAMAPFKRLLTFGVTVNPTFKIRNLIRDSLSAIAQGDLSYNPAENVAKGWKATSKESQTYASMLASGGIIKFGTQENTDRVRAQIERLGGEVLDQQGWDKLKGQMKSLWEAYEEFGDRTENVNRAALYERLIAKGHSHAEAAFMARDLMDFSMSGKWETVRFLTQTVPFLNARLQGLYKLGRAAKEDPRRFAAMAGAVSLASLGLLAAYSDDDDWKKREDWDRDNYWWFKIGDKAFRIPKPFEVGAIGTVAERTAELMLDQEMTGKRFGQRISDMVFNTFAMDPTPQFIKPFIDVYANKDSFSGRPIEGMADERLRPQDRYNERTSEVAKLLGSWGLPDPVRLAKGEYSGLSPKQIDFLLRGYFGWLATVATTATDTIARPALDRGERPAMRLRDTFFAGNFVESLPAGSSRYVSQMYEQAKEVEQAWASHQAALKSGDLERAREIQQDEAPKLRARMAIENAKRQIAELGHQAKRIEGDRSMSAEAKRERLDELETRKNAIAQRIPVMN